MHVAVGAQVAAPFRVGVEGSAGDRHASHGAGADGQSVAIVGGRTGREGGAKLGLG